MPRSNLETAEATLEATLVQEEDLRDGRFPGDLDAGGSGDMATGGGERHLMTREAWLRGAMAGGMLLMMAPQASEAGFGPAGGAVISGFLPAGRYVELVFHGHYDELEGVTAMLLGWASSKGLVFDSEQTDRGERFVSRLELYTNDMANLPSAEWETVLAFKLKD